MNDTQTAPKTYSNPTRELVITDWPSGKYRTTATFTIETDPKRGERAVRVTLNPKTGQPNAPKKLTYAKKVIYATGSDSRLYVLELTAYGHVSIMRGTFDYSEESIFPRDPRYEDVLALFD